MSRPRFDRHREERNLVSISRRRIDSNRIQGFVLGYSRQLVALQYVADFELDGLMILRIADISEVRCRTTEKFYKTLLQQEQLLERVPFGSSFDLTDWRAVISQLAKEHSLMILECEARKEKDFIIGRVLETTAEDVQVRYFSAAAKWQAKPERVKYKDVTSCQVANNYLNVYQRYFERNADQPAAD